MESATALALLPVDSGAQPLMVVPCLGFSLNSAFSVLQGFLSKVPMDSVRKGEHEFRHSSGFIIHYKLLPGDAVVAATLCGIEDNPFSCRGVLQRLEMVVGAFCKDGDISESLIEKRYCDLYLAVEALANAEPTLSSFVSSKDAKDPLAFVSDFSYNADVQGTWEVRRVKEGVISSEIQALWKDGHIMSALPDAVELPDPSELWSAQSHAPVSPTSAPGLESALQRTSKSGLSLPTPSPKGKGHRRHISGDGFEEFLPELGATLDGSGDLFPPSPGHRPLPYRLHPTKMERPAPLEGIGGASGPLSPPLVLTPVHERGGASPFTADDSMDFAFPDASRVASDGVPSLPASIVAVTGDLQLVGNVRERLVALAEDDGSRASSTKVGGEVFFTCRKEEEAPLDGVSFSFVLLHVEGLELIAHDPALVSVLDTKDVYVPVSGPKSKFLAFHCRLPRATLLSPRPIIRYQVLDGKAIEPVQTRVEWRTRAARESSVSACSVSYSLDPAVHADASLVHFSVALATRPPIEPMVVTPSGFVDAATGRFMWRIPTLSASRSQGHLQAAWAYRAGVTGSAGPHSGPELQKGVYVEISGGGVTLSGVSLMQIASPSSSVGVGIRPHCSFEATSFVAASDK